MRKRLRQQPMHVSRSEGCSSALEHVVGIEFVRIEVVCTLIVLQENDHTVCCELTWNHRPRTRFFLARGRTRSASTITGACRSSRTV